MTQVTYIRARDESLPAGGNHPVAGYTIPVTRGLQAAYLFSGGLDLATHNYATGNTQGSVLGAPAEVDRYMWFGPNAWINSGLPEESVVSALVVGRKPPGALWQPAFIGSTKIGEGGLGLYIPGSSITLQVPEAAGNIIVSVKVTDTVAWGAYAAIAPRTGGKYTVHNLTEGRSAVSTSTADRVDVGSDKMQVGKLLKTPETWDTDMLLALWSDVVWTQAEIDALYKWAQGYAADFGITV